MPSNDSSVEEIKSRIDIVELVSEYVSLKKSGHNWKGLCPFHSEKTPSFMVNPARQIYKCFGCGEGGDIFTFVMQNENLDFKEALRLLAKKAGVTLKMSAEHAGRAGEKEVLLKLQNYARSFFQQNLKKSSRAAGYLKRRGLGEKVQQQFSIGYALNSWDALRKHLEGKGFRPEIIAKAGLASKGQKGIFDMFRDRIIFPISNLSGEVIAFGGRVMDTGEPKYLNSPETPLFNKSRVLYGFDLAKKSIKETDRVLFMEGYMDVIVAHMHGFTNAVAPLGTALTAEHGKLVKRFTDNVILVFDSDEAGIRAAKRSAETLFECGLDVKVLALPEKEDPDSFLKKRGKEAFNDLVESPLSIIDFLALQKTERRIIAREAVEIISRISDSLLRDGYVKELSDRMGIKDVFILEKLQKLKKRPSRPGEYVKSVQPEKPVDSNKPKPLDEMYIIKLILQSPEKADEVFKSITEDDFSDPVTGSVLKKIREGLTDFNKLTLKSNDVEKRLLSDIIFKKDFDEIGLEDVDRVLNDCVRSIREKKRKLLIQDLSDRIKDAEKKKDSVLLKELQMKHYILEKSGNK
jgi:DNA primase